MSKILIQVQNTGAWLTVTRLPEGTSDQKVLSEMKSLKTDNNRVRAVDEAGHLIDILP